MPHTGSLLGAVDEINPNGIKWSDSGKVIAIFSNMFLLQCQNGSAVSVVYSYN